MVGFQKNYHAVIKVKIIVEENLFLHLDTISGMDFFLKQTKEIFDNLSFSIALKQENKCKNLCFALDLLKEKMNIKVVSFTFIKERPTYAAQDFKDFKENYFSLPYGFVYKEKQICTTDNSVIFEKECVYTNYKPKWN
jgi:hypothetical protein